MIIDGVLGSEAIDSSGEVLDVAGADISDVEKGTCLLNWEHTPGDKSASTLVGVVLKAKKIYKRDDCENDRQRKYWDEIKMPYIYGVSRLYDGAGHEEAKRIAAIIRDHAANNEPIVCRYSVEGATLKKEDNRLSESVVRRVAVTVKPCNRTAVSGLIEDPNAPHGFDKKPIKEKTRDLLDFSQAEKSETDPMFARLGSSWSHVGDPMVKADVAGVPSAAPSTLEGGAALQKEDLGPKKPKKGKKWSVKDVIKALGEAGYMDAQFNRSEFRGFAKTLMPEASDDFLDHFTDVVEDYHVKRTHLQKKEGATSAAKIGSEPTSAAKTPQSKATSAAPKPAKTPAKTGKVVAPKQKTLKQDLDDNPVRLSVATIRGVPVASNKAAGKWSFDEEKGILHTKKGSFPLYNPDKGFETKTHALAKLSPFYHQGVLHVAPGADMAQIPHNAPNPGFREIFNSPHVDAFHSEKVMPGWMRLHESTEAGTLPEEAVMHAVGFSQMSPNTPVIVQENMWSHLHDTMEDAGIDMRDPEFGKMAANWKKRDKPQNYPRLGREYFENNPGIHLSNASGEKNRKVGDLKSFMLANNKFDNVAQYHKLHPTMVDLVKRHGTDARSAAKELMAMKLQELAWKNRRQTFKSKLREHLLASGMKDDHSEYVKQKMAEAEAAGKFKRKGEPPAEREPGADDDDESPLPFDPKMLQGADDFDVDSFEENAAQQHPSIAKGSLSRLTGRRWYRAKFKQEANDAGLQDGLGKTLRAEVKKKFPSYEGVPVPGLAPKTGRYALLMMGGGNSFVPDTHMVRHMFGMDNAHDGRTLMYLKSGLWRAGNHHVLEAMDRWYSKNHPAPQMMREHPKWGEKFQKDPEQAIGPAFWRHWAAIAPDERTRGLQTDASQNEGTTHEPYFLAMDKLFKDTKLAKSAPDDEMAGKLAALHHQYAEDYGEIPAQMMYFHHIVPHLFEAAEYRTKHDDLSDFAKSITHVDALGIELRKAAMDVQVAKLADPNIPTVHAVYYKDRDHGGTEHLAGRFALHQGQVHHLEDYHGLLEKLIPEGQLTLKGVSSIHGMKMSPHLRIAVETMDDKNPKLREPANPTKMQDRSRLPRPPSVFEYHRAGFDKPHTIEVKDGNYMLDGEKMSHDEVKAVLANHASGAATLRYKAKQKGNFDSIQKAEVAFEALMKAEPTMRPHELVQYIRDAEAKGAMPKGAGDAATKHFFEDPMVEGIGNKVAFKDHLEKNPNRPGAYVQMDGNDFSKINNAFGHAAGDSAIKAFGTAAREAMNETVGQENGKLFRNGGDEFVAHVPSHEHAAQFSRALSDKLNALAPIGGTHKMSMSFGFGADPHTADKALYEAKKQKIEQAPGALHRVGQKLGIVGDKRKYKVGQVPNLAHSMMPGHEGPLPVHDAGQHAVHQTLTPPTPEVVKPVPMPKQQATA